MRKEKNKIALLHSTWHSFATNGVRKTPPFKRNIINSTIVLTLQVALSCLDRVNSILNVLLERLVARWKWNDFLDLQ